MTQRLLTVPIVIKSDVLPYTAPFHLGGQIGVHLSWTPRWDAGGAIFRRDGA